MGVRRDRPVAREVFAGGFHASGMHTVNEARGHDQRFLRIGMIRTLANGGADMPDIKNRRKTDIDIHGDHFTGHQPARLLSQLSALFQPLQRGKDCAAGKRVKPSRKRCTRPPS